MILPLESETVGPILAAIGGTVPRSILHIQVEKAGLLQLGLYDNFAPKAMLFGPALSPQMITSFYNNELTSPWTEQ